MVKVTREESFRSRTEMVAEGTGDLDRVSNAIPLTLPFFCAAREVVIKPNKSRKQTFLIAEIFSATKIFLQHGKGS